MTTNHLIAVISLLTFCPSSGAQPDTGVPWRLADVLKETAQKIERDDASATNARLELQMLQALGKTRVELRPQFSLLSFSNPLLLAASLGGSLSINRRTAPSPATIALAKLNVVEAEIRHTSARINAQVQAAHYFFALAEARELVAASCRASDAPSGRGQLERLVAARRKTKSDLIRFEQDTLALEGTCVEARGQATTVALALARITGSATGPDQVAIATDDMVSITSPYALPEAAQLIKTAFESREDLKLLSEHIGHLAGAQNVPRAQLDSVSFGYGYLKNVQGTQHLAEEYLLGGKVGHVDGGFFLSLRKTGADAATAAFLRARFDGLQGELDNLKTTLRREVEDNLQRASLAAERLKVSRRKASLAAELHELTTVRERRGLEAESDDVWTKRESARTAAEAARAEMEWKQNVFTILAICEPAKLARAKESGVDRASEDAHKISSLLAETAIADSSPRFLVSADADSDSAAEPLPPAMALPAGAAELQAQAISKADAGDTLQVRVSIDKRGHVTDAVVIGGDDRSASSTAFSQAIAIAKTFRFKPAWAGGARVPSFSVIVFNTGPHSLEPSYTYPLQSAADSARVAAAP